MPCFSPLVWAEHAPPYAIRLESPIEAARIVRDDADTVCLPTFPAAIETLRLLGASGDTIARALRCAQQGPKTQRTYCLDDCTTCDGCDPRGIEDLPLNRFLTTETTPS